MRVCEEVSVTERLREMRALIQAGWCRGVSFRHAAGEPIGRSDFLALRARGLGSCCCVLAAVYLTRREGDAERAWEAVTARLRAAAPVGLENEPLSAINDALLDQAAALAWLDRAITLAGKRG